MRRLIIAALLAAPGAASAAERTYTITDFDRIVVDAPYGVSVTTGPAVSARATGDQRAVDRIAVSVANRTLRITRDKSAWGGWSGEGEGSARVTITVPMVEAAMLAGPGSLAIDRMRGGTLSLNQAGTGSLRVARLEADRLTLTQTGSGSVDLGGAVKQAAVSQRGSGAIAGDGLAVEDLTLVTAGSGSAMLSASRTAKVTSTGAGMATVSGTAACTVKSTGSGVVNCGG